MMYFISENPYRGIVKVKKSMINIIGLHILRHELKNYTSLYSKSSSIGPSYNLDLEAILWDKYVHGSFAKSFIGYHPILDRYNKLTSPSNDYLESFNFYIMKKFGGIGKNKKIRDYRVDKLELYTMSRYKVKNSILKNINTYIWNDRLTDSNHKYSDIKIVLFS